MKKFAAAAVVGFGALAVTGSAASSAVDFRTSGNIQYTVPQYACTPSNYPAAVLAYRTLNVTESKVTFSAPGYTPFTQTNVKPYTGFDTFATAPGVAGHSVTVTIKGSTSGSVATVKLNVPATCAGLPKITADGAKIDWSKAPKATATPKPTATPSTSAPAPKPSTSAPAGPRVETDYVAEQNTTTAALALTMGGLAVAAGAGVVAARRRK